MARGSRYAAAYEVLVRPTTDEDDEGMWVLHQRRPSPCSRRNPFLRCRGVRGRCSSLHFSGVVAFAAAAPPSLPLSRLARISRACFPSMRLRTATTRSVVACMVAELCAALVLDLPSL
uniref:Uncharacterized protein n=1 Tax=Oryza glumipatula TaxID=40148 RepID=A0A0E0ASH8_9ORYZ